MSTQIQQRPNMTQAEYRAHPAVNQSSLKVLGESPQLYYGRFVSRYIPETRPSPAMQFGTAVEEYIRTGGKHQFKLLPAEIKQRRGKAWEEYRDSLPPGTQVLLQSEWDEMQLDELETIAANLRQHDKAAKLLAGGEWHRRIVWEDRDTGLECKAEIDLVYVNAMLVDLKTCADPSPKGFAQQAVNLGYDVQAAWYQWGFSEVYGDTDAPFIFICVRNKQPFNVEVYELDDLFLQRGREKFRWLLNDLTRRRNDNDWFTETHGKIVALSAPRWSVIDGHWNGE